MGGYTGGVTVTTWVPSSCSVRAMRTSGRAEGAAGPQRERQQQLVGQVLTDGGLRGEVALRLLHALRRHRFRADALAAEAGEEFGHLLEPHLGHADVARPLALRRFVHLAVPLVPLQLALDDAQLPLGDVARQAGHHPARPHALERAALGQLQPVPRRRRFDLRAEPAAAAREEAVPVEPQLHLRPQRLETGQEDSIQKVERRRRLVVGAALKGRLRRRAGVQQHRQHGLEDEAGAAGGADREAVFPRLDGPRHEPQLARAGVVALHLGAGDLRHGAHRAAMLVQQPRLGASAANVPDMQRPSGDAAQRQRGAQDLPAAFAHLAVECDRLGLHRGGTVPGAPGS
jgi:hypothetical protein